MTAPTLTEFLLARISEDEAVAQMATSGPWRYEPVGDVDDGAVMADGEGFVALTSYDTLSDTTVNSDNDGAHIARHDPARVLAECKAKRRIVEALFDAEDAVSRYDQSVRNDSPSFWRESENAHALRFAAESLATAHSDHPDYDEAWRP